MYGLYVGILVIVGFIVGTCQSDCRIPGLLYGGSRNTTKSGLPCQRWDRQTPHIHTYGVFSTAKDNYCRNFDQEEAWCFTTNSEVRLESCGVEVCDNPCFKGDLLLKESIAQLTVGICTLPPGSDCQKLLNYTRCIQLLVEDKYNTTCSEDLLRSTLLELAEFIQPQLDFDISECKPSSCLLMNCWRCETEKCVTEYSPKLLNPGLTEQQLCLYGAQLLNCVISKISRYYNETCTYKDKDVIIKRYESVVKGLTDYDINKCKFSEFSMKVSDTSQILNETTTMSVKIIIIIAVLFVLLVTVGIVIPVFLVRKRRQNFQRVKEQKGILLKYVPARLPSIPKSQMHRCISDAGNGYAHINDFDTIRCTYVKSGDYDICLDDPYDHYLNFDDDKSLLSRDMISLSKSETNISQIEPQNGIGQVHTICVENVNKKANEDHFEEGKLYPDKNETGQKHNKDNQSQSQNIDKECILYDEGKYEFINLEHPEHKDSEYTKLVPSAFDVKEKENMEQGRGISNIVTEDESQNYEMLQKSDISADEYMSLQNLVKIDNISKGDDNDNDEQPSTSSFQLNNQNKTIQEEQKTQGYDDSETNVENIYKRLINGTNNTNEQLYEKLKCDNTNPTDDEKANIEKAINVNEAFQVSQQDSIKNLHESIVRNNSGEKNTSNVRNKEIIELGCDEFGKEEDLRNADDCIPENGDYMEMKNKEDSANEIEEYKDIEKKESSEIENEEYIQMEKADHDNEF